MAMVNISIFKAMEFQKAVEERFGVHIHISDNCSGLYFSFDEPASDEIVDFARGYFADFEGRSLDIVLTPNRTHLSLEDKR